MKRKNISFCVLFCLLTVVGSLGLALLLGYLPNCKNEDFSAVNTLTQSLYAIPTGVAVSLLFILINYYRTRIKLLEEIKTVSDTFMGKMIGLKGGCPIPTDNHLHLLEEYEMKATLLTRATGAYTVLKEILSFIKSFRQDLHDGTVQTFKECDEL